MDDLGELLTGLPMPVGPIVTGLFPILVIGGVAVGAWAQRRRRTALALCAGIVAIAGVVGMVAFVSAT